MQQLTTRNLDFEEKVLDKLGALENQVAALNTKVDTKVGALENRVGAVENQIAALNTKVDTKVGALDNKVGALENKVDGPALAAAAAAGAAVLSAILAYLGMRASAKEQARAQIAVARIMNERRRWF